MSEPLRNLRKPVVIVALEGWNDAADSATRAAVRLADLSDAETIDTIDDEQYYDYTSQRPQISQGNEGTVIDWPGIEIGVGHLPHHDIVLAAGPEPNLRWRSLTRTLVSIFRMAQPELVVLMGAMLSESPHSRPTPVGITTCNDQLRERLGAQKPDYEGPTGLLGVLSDACEQAHMPTLTMWASVPHYLAHPPNPKAAAALLARLEDLLDETLPLGELAEEAIHWETAVNELIANDPDMAEYVTKLEEQADHVEPQALSGEAIAAEFQRYLRRQHRDGRA